MINAEFYNLAGGICEITGVFLMANAYLKVPMYQVPIVLISAIWRGGNAKKMAAIKQLSSESVLASLQGISLVGLGFILQVIPEILALI